MIVALLGRNELEISPPKKSIQTNILSCKRTFKFDMGAQKEAENTSLGGN